MAFSINFGDDILIKVSGITVAVHDVIVEFDSDGDVDTITADGVTLSPISNDHGIRALHMSICSALDEPKKRSWIEEELASWRADAPNRAADYRRDRAA